MGPYVGGPLLLGHVYGGAPMGPCLGERAYVAVFREARLWGRTYVAVSREARLWGRSCWDMSRGARLWGRV